MLVFAQIRGQLGMRGIGAQVWACKDQAHWEVTRNTSENRKTKELSVRAANLVDINSNNEHVSEADGLLSMFGFCWGQIYQGFSSRCPEPKQMSAGSSYTILLKNGSSRMHWARALQIQLCQPSWLCLEAWHLSEIVQVCEPFLALCIHGLSAFCIAEFTRQHSKAKMMCMIIVRDNFGSLYTHS